MKMTIVFSRCPLRSSDSNIRPYIVVDEFNHGVIRRLYPLGIEFFRSAATGILEVNLAQFRLRIPGRYHGTWDRTGIQYQCGPGAAAADQRARADQIC